MSEMKWELTETDSELATSALRAGAEYARFMFLFKQWCDDEDNFSRMKKNFSMEVLGYQFDRVPCEVYMTKGIDCVLDFLRADDQKNELERFRGELHAMLGCSEDTGPTRCPGCGNFH